MTSRCTCIQCFFTFTVLPPTVSPEKQQIVNDSNETKPRGVESTKLSKDALSDEEEVEIEDLVNNEEVDIQRDKITVFNYIFLAMLTYYFSLAQKSCDA